MKSIVYFTREITPEAVVRLYEKLGVKLEGKIAIKVHSGEVGNQNFIRPEFWQPIISHVGGVVTECNTAYPGQRETTEKHIKTLKRHGWSDYYETEILDGEREDLELAIPKGRVIKKNFVGGGLAEYSSVLVLSHFKGHPSGGYGGALKQLSIGFASSYGKKYIHGCGCTEDFWHSEQNDFLDSMAEAASSVVDYIHQKGGELVYVNVMKNMSVDCDCCAKAEDPCMSDIGMLISLDPVAIDRACLDLVYASEDRGRDHLIERIESRNGTRTVCTAEALGVGTTEYELVEI